MKTLRLIGMTIMMVLVAGSLIACGGGDDDDNNAGSTYHVTVSDDGKTSNGAIFSAIDEKNFFLDYIKYTVEEGHLVVSGYDKNGFSGNANIASRLTYKGNTYEVLKINRGVFKSSSKIYSVTIPSTVTEIGNEAFYESNVASVTISGSVTKIGWSAFEGCDKLTSITIPNGVKSISERAFCGCVNLASLKLGDDVTYLGDFVFAGCSSLSSITIPNSVKKLGNGAFYGCKKFTSITLLPTTPPICGSLIFDDTNNCPIYVPSQALDIYKKVNELKTYVDRIVGN